MPCIWNQNVKSRSEGQRPLRIVHVRFGVLAVGVESTSIPRSKAFTGLRGSEITLNFTVTWRVDVQSELYVYFWFDSIKRLTRDYKTTAVMVTAVSHGSVTLDIGLASPCKAVQSANNFLPHSAQFDLDIEIDAFLIIGAYNRTSARRPRFLWVRAVV